MCTHIVRVEHIARQARPAPAATAASAASHVWCVARVVRAASDNFIITNVLWSGPSDDDFAMC